MIETLPQPRARAIHYAKPAGAGNHEFATHTLAHRLVHRSEEVNLEGKSYRLKEAQERADRRAQKRRGGKR